MQGHHGFHAGGLGRPGSGLELKDAAARRFAV